MPTRCNRGWRYIRWWSSREKIPVNHRIWLRFFPTLTEVFLYPDWGFSLPWLRFFSTLTEVFPYPEVFLYPDWGFSLPWLRVSVLFLSVRQMPGLNSQSRGTDRISSELSLCCACHCVMLLSLCCSVVIMLYCYYVALLLFVLSYVLIVCTVPLPPGVNPVAVDKYIYLKQNIYISFFFQFAYLSLTFPSETNKT